VITFITTCALFALDGDVNCFTESVNSKYNIEQVKVADAATNERLNNEFSNIFWWTADIHQEQDL